MKDSVLISMAKILKAIGNMKRLEILYHLKGKELNVGELQELVNLSQSALLQHLALLREEEIVKTRRSAQTIFYSIQDNSVIKIMEFLETVFD